MTKNLTNYQIKAPDFRKQLRTNERRTKIVIAIFVAIYLCIGLIFDLYIHTALNGLPLGTALNKLITFKITPIATLIAGAIALISILITFSLYDRIVLFGTKHREITPENAKSIREQQFYNVTAEMQIAAGLRYMPKLYIIDAEYMNAFASGYSEKSALIAITSGLLQKLERDELQAVIAHELSHIRHHDIKLTLVATVLTNLMLIAVDMLFYNIMFSANRKRSSKNNGSGNILILIIILLRYLLPIITILLMLYLSRTREYMADAGSVELTRDNTPLGKALLKISNDYQKHQQNYSELYSKTRHEEVRRAAYIFDPQDAGIAIKKSISTMFSTHPSIQARLKALGFKDKD